MRGGVQTANAAFLDKLESSVIGSPHPFGGDLALELGSDVRGGHFGQGAFKFRFLEIECEVGNWWVGPSLVDQVRQGEEDMGGLPERPV